MQLRRLVFPAPFGPMIPVTLPSRTVKSTRVSAAMPPKERESDSTARSGGDGVGPGAAPAMSSPSRRLRVGCEATGESTFVPAARARRDALRRDRLSSASRSPRHVRPSEFYDELRHRRVLRGAAVYAVAASAVLLLAERAV